MQCCFLWVIFTLKLRIEYASVGCHEKMPYKGVTQPVMHKDENACHQKEIYLSYQGIIEKHQKN